MIVQLQHPPHRFLRLNHHHIDIQLMTIIGVANGFTSYFLLVIRRDLRTPTVKEEIRRYSSQYSARLSAHPNGLVVNLIEQPDSRRLRRHQPNALPTRFLV
jgi:hypothetical protein